jgi:hypothetical protein
MIVLEIVSTLVQIGFQVTAAYVALIGLQSWIIQLKGKTEYEVAKNVIAGAYRVRDEIRRCQDTYITLTEWAEYQPKRQETAAQRMAMQSRQAYRQRYEKVVEAMNDWYPSTVEAEALFGEEARYLIDKLMDSCKLLRSSIEIYHSSLYSGQEDSNDKIFKNTIRGISSKSDPYMDIVNSDDDGFQKNLDDSIKGIEAYFSQFITAKAFTLNPLQLIHNIQISGRG